MRLDGPPTPSSPRHPRERRQARVHWALLAGVLLLALILRVIAGLESYWGPLEAGFAQMWDGRYYDQVAGYILQGEWLGGDEVFYLAPLYSYVLALVYTLAGTGGAPEGLPAVMLYQALAGTGCVLLVYLIARRLADATTGLLAAGLAAVYQPLIYQGSILMPTVTVVLVHLLALWLILVAQDRHSLWPWIGAGAALAVAAIGHGTALLWAALVMAWIALGGIERPLRRRLVVLACLLAGLAPPILAITARNYAVGRDLVLLTSNAGKNLYVGNNPTADGTFGPHALPVWGSHLGTYIHREPRGPDDPAPSEVSRALSRKALRFVASEPDRALALIARKMELLVNWYEIPINDNLYFAERHSRVLALPLVGFGVIAPLALAGLLTALLGARRWSPLLVALAAQVAAFAIMFVLGRYRAFAAALMIVLAAAFAVWLVGELRARRWRLALAGLVLLALAVWVVHHDVPGFHRERGFGQQHLAVARSLYQDGRLDEARDHARAALRASFAPWRNTDVKKAHVDLLLGRIAAERGGWAEAARLFERGLDRLRWARRPAGGPAPNLKGELLTARREALAQIEEGENSDAATPL